MWVEEEMKRKRVGQVEEGEVVVGREQGCSFGLKAWMYKLNLFMNKRRAQRRG